MLKTTSILLVHIVISGMLSACAFGTRQVNLTYNPAVERGSAVPGSLGRVAVARFADRRSSDEGAGNLLGKVRNTYGMTTANVEANQDPVLWVADGIARSLAAQGFKVEKVESPAAAGGLPTVTGTVTRASGGMYMRMDANVSADVGVERLGQSLLSTQCEGTATQVAWTASTGEYEEVFASAMDSFLSSCVPKLLPVLTQPAATAGQ